MTSNQFDAVLQAYEEYLNILGEELSELSSIAFIRGWESKRVQIGAEARKKIKETIEQYRLSKSASDLLSQQMKDISHGIID